MDNKKIKIAFFLPTLEGAGTERNVVNLVNNLDRKKYVISLVLGKVKGVFIKEISKDVLIIDLNTSYTLGLFFKLIKYFRKERPDIFVSAFPHINIVSIMARSFSRTKTKIVVTEQSITSLLSTTARTFSRKLVARFILPLLMRFIYPLAEAIVCVSKGVSKDLLKIIHNSDKISIVYNPIINKKIYKLAEEPIDHFWFSNLEIPIIIMVGRLTKIKDYPDSLKAFSLVVQERSARLVVLGKGPEEKKIKLFAHKLGLSDKILFLGFQKNPYKYIKKAKVFVLSSFHEGFGNVIVEAMACGTPVVSTNCMSGPREIIENEENGILVPVADQEALAKAVLEVLNNPFLAHKLSEQGKKRAEYFSIEKSVKKYEEIFDKLQE